jgi:sarcosine oxidase gamma subunit
VAEVTLFRQVCGCAVALDARWQAASLRSLSAQAPVAALREIAGLAPPATLAACASANDHWRLAWRSPTEMLCLTSDASMLAALAARLSALPEVCLVDLSCALRVLRVAGNRSAELLGCLGGSDGVPAPGQACRSRMADVAVLSVAVSAEETLLVVDRAYLPHLAAWIRATLADLGRA